MTGMMNHDVCDTHGKQVLHFCDRVTIRESADPGYYIVRRGEYEVKLLRRFVKVLQS